jgi:hypothetical protein
MRERAQASVETVAIMGVAVALAAALALGVVRLGPPFASLLREALSGVFASGTATAPSLDGLERALLSGATSAEADGPTMLDVRTHLRSRLGRVAADTAFNAVVKPLVERALADASIESDADAMTVVDRASEDAWVRHHLNPGRMNRASELVAGSLASRIRLLAVISDLGIGTDGPDDAIQPGNAAGDIVVRVDDGAVRDVVLRRRPGAGFAVIAMADASGVPAQVARR